MYEDGKIILKGDLIQNITSQQSAIFCNGTTTKLKEMKREKL
jgi:hypothetical protein